MEELNNLSRLIVIKHKYVEACSRVENDKALSIDSISYIMNDTLSKEEYEMLEMNFRALVVATYNTKIYDIDEIIDSKFEIKSK